MKRLSILVVTLAVLVCAPARAAEPRPGDDPEAVVIGNAPVGGLTAEAATEYVKTQFALPLVVGYGTYVLEAPTPVARRTLDPEGRAAGARRSAEHGRSADGDRAEACAAGLHRGSQHALRAQAGGRASLPAQPEAVDLTGEGWPRDQSHGRRGALTAALSRVRASRRSEAEARQGEGDAQELRSGGRDQARRQLSSRSTTGCGLSSGSASQRARASTRRRSAVPRRRQVEEPLVVSAELAVGEGQGAGPARPG